MACDLYPLPPLLKQCESVDSTDTRYINQMYDTLVNPFKRSLDIELCNEKLFNKLLQISTPQMFYDHDTLNIF